MCEDAVFQINSPQQPSPLAIHFSLSLIMKCLICRQRSKQNLPPSLSKVPFGTNSSQPTSSCSTMMYPFGKKFHLAMPTISPFVGCTAFMQCAVASRSYQAWHCRVLYSSRRRASASLPGSTGHARGAMGAVVRSPPRRWEGVSMSEKSEGSMYEISNGWACRWGVLAMSLGVGSFAGVVETKEADILDWKLRSENKQYFSVATYLLKRKCFFSYLHVQRLICGKAFTKGKRVKGRSHKALPSFESGTH